MLHEIHRFLYDHHLLVLCITVPVMVWYGRVLFAHLASAQAPASDRARPPEFVRPTGKPSAKFAETVKVDDIPRSLDAGVAAHIEKGRARTDKLAPVTVGEAKKQPDAAEDEMGDMFSGLGDDAGPATAAPAAPGADPLRRGLSETGAIRRVARMEEIGFHHSIPSDIVEPGKAPPMPPEAAARLNELSLGSDEPAKSSAPELDAILARIDQVLSQDVKKTEVLDPVAPVGKPDLRTRPTEVLPPAPAKPDPRQAATQVLNPIGDAPKSEAKSDPAKKTPLWARADAFDEDADKDEKKDQGKQLGLFDQQDNKKT